MNPTKHVAIIVLGDVGRSPRMQYHAFSLGSEPEYSCQIKLIGYDGENVLPQLLALNNVKIQRIHNITVPFLQKLGIVHTFIKGIGLLFSIIGSIGVFSPCDVVLVQNPPAIPVLLALVVINFLRFLFFQDTIRVVIDWHNLGFSMFSMKYGPNHLLVHLSRWIEHWLCHLCFAHICVSNAMKQWLRDYFGIEATVFYDRPFKKIHSQPSHFEHCYGFEVVENNPGEVKDASQKQEKKDSMKDNMDHNITEHKNEDNKELSLRQRHDLFKKIGLIEEKVFPNLIVQEMMSISCDESTIQTVAINGNIEWKGMTDCFVAITATSWTEDEDFDMLVSAALLTEKILKEWNENASTSNLSSQDQANHPRQRRLLIAITGKGALKKKYEEIFLSLQQEGRLKFVSLVTLWLEIEDYPRFLSCCDVGISLHTSTSGLDLPMKVLDMLGASLPVLGVSFPTLPELIRHDENGWIFNNDQELATRLGQLMNAMNSSSDKRQIERFIRSARDIPTWSENWNMVMKPFYQRILR